MPIVLACITGLLVVSALSLILVRHRAATPVVYGACLTISLTLCAVSLLSIGQASSETVLPLGLPWLGAHFRLDPLASALTGVAFGDWRQRPVGVEARRVMA